MGKRKFDEVERDGFARQRMQLLHDANVNPNGFPSRGHISPEFRGSKYVRLGGESESVSDKHLNVDQVAVKKAFFHFVKLVNENPSMKRNFLEDGKHGRIQCVACGSRFDLCVWTLCHLKDVVFLLYGYSVAMCIDF